MSENRKLLVRILHVNCFITDEAGFDDLFLVVNGSKIWPKKKKHFPVRPGRTVVDVEVKNIDPETTMNIEFWDYDYISRNDLLGKVTVFVDEPGGPYFTDMEQNTTETQKAKYNLEWEIDYV